MEYLIGVGIGLIISFVGLTIFNKREEETTERKPKNGGGGRDGENRHRNRY